MRFFNLITQENEGKLYLVKKKIRVFISILINVLMMFFSFSDQLDR